MPEILALLQNIAPVVSVTILRQLSQVIYGMLISNGRITMLEISRWTERGGSYRTIQRLYHGSLLWLQIQGLFLRAAYSNPTMSTLPPVMKSCLVKREPRPMGWAASFPACNSG
jgi:hypothetical protein